MHSSDDRQPAMQHDQKNRCFQAHHLLESQLKGQLHRSYQSYRIHQCQLPIPQPYPITIQIHLQEEQRYEYGSRLLIRNRQELFPT